MSDVINPALCPLCGTANQCVRASPQAGDEQAAACWCASEVFAAELLARVPSASRRKACICQACVQASYAQSSHDEI